MLTPATDWVTLPFVKITNPKTASTTANVTTIILLSIKEGFALLDTVRFLVADDLLGLIVLFFIVYIISRAKFFILVN